MIYYSEGKALKPKTMKYYEDHTLAQPFHESAQVVHGEH